MNDIKFRVNKSNKFDSLELPLELPLENVIYENIVIYNKAQELWDLLLSVFGGNEEVEDEEFFFKNKFVQLYRKTINNDLETLKKLLTSYGQNNDITVNHLTFDSKSKSLILNHDLIKETVINIFQIPLILSKALKDRNKEWLEFWRNTNLSKSTVQVNETSTAILIKKISDIKEKIKSNTGGFKKVSKLQVQKEFERLYGIKRSTFYELLNKNKIDFDSI